MEIQLIAIRYTDYRNIKTGEVLNVEKITALVGANESGKSNLLESILYLKKENRIKPIDTSIGSERNLNGLSPKLEFFLSLGESLVEEFKNYIKDFNSDWIINWSREADDFSLGFVDKTFNTITPKFVNVWKNISPSPIDVTLRNGQSITLQPNDEMIGKLENALSLARLRRKGLIQKLENQTIVDKLKERILNNLPTVIKWDYKEENYYIKDEVPWNEFLNEAGKFKANERLFNLAAEEFPAASEYREKLTSFGPNSRRIADYLDRVGSALDKVIKDTWNQSNIKIKLEIRESKLDISIYDGGQRKPPSIRSEGLKWFISFLLEFRAQGGTLSNHIFLFDQPGDTLHPGGQKELTQRFEDISTSNQIIYATQSPFMVDRNFWKRIQFLKSEDGCSEVRKPTLIDISNDELLRQVLGYTLSDVGQANELNIVTEGYWDKIIFRWHARRINEESGITKFDFNKTSIFDAEGGRSIKTRVDELVQAGLNAIGVFDSDNKTPLNKARGDKRLANRFLAIDEVSGNEFLTGEDFIPGELYINAVEAIIGRTITATRTKNSLLKQPRWGRLGKYFKRTRRGNLTNEDKEKLWLLIESKLENFRFENLDAITKDAADKLINDFLKRLGRLS